MNSSLETELSSLDSKLASLNRSVRDQAQTSGVTDTILTEMVENQVAEQAKQQLKAAKDQWIDDVSPMPMENMYMYNVLVWDN